MKIIVVLRYKVRGSIWGAVAELLELLNSCVGFVRGLIDQQFVEVFVPLPDSHRVGAKEGAGQYFCRVCLPCVIGFVCWVDCLLESWDAARSTDSSPCENGDFLAFKQVLCCLFRRFDLDRVTIL